MNTKKDINKWITIYFSNPTTKIQIEETYRRYCEMFAKKYPGVRISKNMFYNECFTKLLKLEQQQQTSLFHEQV